MVGIAVSRRSLRMTIETVGRVGPQCDHVYDLLIRAAVTGCAGTVRRTPDLCPVRNIMTGTTGNVIGTVAGTQLNAVSMVRMRGRPRTRVTGGAVAAGAEVLTDCQALKAAVCIVTTRAGVMGGFSRADQSVVMAAGAACRANSDKSAVIRRTTCVQGAPVVTVSGGAVARRCFVGLLVNQGAGTGVMSGGAGVMSCVSCAYQGVVMTA